MTKRIMALAAVLLAGGIGAAAAQSQTSQGPMQKSEPGQAVPVPGSTPPPYRQQVQTPDIAPLGPNIDKPKANPSAAGELMQWKGPPSRRHTGDKDTREHSGAVGTSFNTDPWKALKAGGQPRAQGKTTPSGIQPTPYSTMNRETGR
jgi:hypothetical protein